MSNTFLGNNHHHHHPHHHHRLIPESHNFELAVLITNSMTDAHLQYGFDVA
eukprot:CAMPEP_0118702296 /NCGR_PEP_ID=MMETSP0800-20121206/17802_1 /TAXON_ID=210618 ORGANISM="Striatella unipunctata, Strain CCMP2910" /NCGR_SAMPLE_ID=MMETSP0800 /ASSEMBLY_ACC=CAM_ASM_000638 /LENGTH=50 /DNA_ID=CAMNT_0006603461 /DNA_START=211 /DNA_END=359 /DNA_ORIENTATION=+